jgi:hypothetical protein
MPVADRLRATVFMSSLLRYHKPFTEAAQKRSVRRLAPRVSKLQTPLQNSPIKLDYLGASLILASAKTNSIRSARLQSTVALCGPTRGLSKQKPRPLICCEWPLSCHQRRWIKIGYAGMAIDLVTKHQP